MPNKYFLTAYTCRTVLTLIMLLRAIISCADEETSTSLISMKPQSFFKERYRGWLWFEDKTRKKQQLKELEGQQITAEEAQREIEELKAKMDEKRSIMIARPSPESVRDYIQYEEIMWQRALLLDAAYRQAKFRYPKYFNKLSDPHNVHAVKFKRRLEQEALEAKIKDFASRFDLVLFSKGECRYCHEFAPILKRFSEFYGFKVEEASIDGDMTHLFVGKALPHIASRLGIDAIPTVVVVSKDGKTAFELIRGYATHTELEEYVGLAIEYIKQREQK